VFTGVWCNWEISFTIWVDNVGSNTPMYAAAHAIGAQSGTG